MNAKRLDTIAVMVGAILINVALYYGVGVRFGWWGFAFWAGFGLILASIKAAK